MTTLRRPLPSAVRVTVPLTPLPFCSTSFAFTVVSAAALIGRHSRAETAASMSELRNLLMYPLPKIGSIRVLGDHVISSYSTPQNRQPISPDTAALLAAVLVPPTYIP